MYLFNCEEFNLDDFDFIYIMYINIIYIMVVINGECEYFFFYVMLIY